VKKYGRHLFLLCSLINPSQGQGSAKLTSVSGIIFDPSIAIRESGVRNIAESGGLGRGYFQIDLGQTGFTLEQAMDPQFSADYAARTLSSALDAITRAGVTNPADAIELAAISWNRGLGFVLNSIAQGRTVVQIDQYTAHHNYGATIRNLQQCLD
jgi:hypothetical protein